MKKLIFSAVICLIIGLLIIFKPVNYGNISDVKREYGNDFSINEQGDIAKAMDEVERFFESTFEECTLKSLRYEIDYSKSDCIYLSSVFKVRFNKVLGPFSTHFGYHWLIVYNGERWYLKDYGQG